MATAPAIPAIPPTPPMPPRAAVSPAPSMTPSFVTNPDRAIGRPADKRQPFLELGYELRETLGEGEFGKVKLAVQRTNGTKVAIKIFKRSRLDDAEKQLKLMREIAILQAVVHKSIVRLWDVLETDDLVGLVIEYASGGELFDYIFNCKYLAEPEAARLFAQLVDGVNYLHSKNVIHRDLKLENLLLSADKDLVIIDFGFANQFPDRNPNDRDAMSFELAPFRAPQVPDRHFLMATSCGSPCYAAPELVVADGYVGTCADVWSCGVILFAMLAGYLPFDDDPENPHGDNITLLYKYILMDPTPLHLPSHLSPDAADLVRRMIVPNPQERATMLEIMNHPWLAPVRHLLVSDYSAPPPVPTKDPLSVRSASRASSRYSAAVATGAAAASAISSPAAPATRAVPASDESVLIASAMDTSDSLSPPEAYLAAAAAAVVSDASFTAASPVAAAVESEAFAQHQQQQQKQQQQQQQQKRDSRQMADDNDLVLRYITGNSVPNSPAPAPKATPPHPASPKIAAAAAAAAAAASPSSVFAVDLPARAATPDPFSMSRHAQPATSAANKRHTFQGTMGAPSTTSSSSGSGRFRIGDLFSRIRNATTSSSRRDTNASFERSATLAVLPSLASDFPSRAPTAAAASPPPPPPKVTNGTGSTTPHSRFSTLAGGGDQVMVRTNAAPAPTVSRHATADAATFSFLAADPHATPAPQAHHQRSKSVGGSSIVASIRERARSLTRGGSAMSETVYERTDVPPVPMLPEFLPAGEEGSAATTGYVSVYAHRDDADAARGRKRTKSTTTTGGSKPRGRSLTDVLMGRPKPVAEVPPPLPTSFFRTMQPRTVTEAEARGFLAEALTTRMPEVALFEARKVLDGLGAVVVGHGTDPVRGIPGHGDGAFVLKCRLKLGKKTGVTDTRLKAELDALELLERDEAFSPVSLPSVAAAEAVSSAAPRDVPEDTAAISAAEAEKHRRRKSSGTTASAAGGSNPLDHLSVYSGYSSGAASSGPVVLPSDYPALYSQPDVAAAIAAGSGRPGTTPKLAPGQLSASSSNSPQTYETAMLSSSTSAAAAANATYAHAQPVSVHYSSYYSSTPTMSHNARAISEGVHIAQVAKVDASASLSGKVLKNLRAFGSDLLFTVEIVAVPGHKATWAIVFHRTKGSTVSYGRVKHIVLRKLYRSDEKMRQLLG